MNFLKKQKNGIICTAIAVVILAISLIYGGGSPSDNVEKRAHGDAKNVLSDSMQKIESSAKSGKVINNIAVQSDSQTASDKTAPIKAEKSSDDLAVKKTSEETIATAQENNTPETSTKQKDENTSEPYAEAVQPEIKEEFKKEIIDITNKDTSPAPSDIPDTASGNTKDTVQNEKSEELTCTLSVRCDTILGNTASLNPDKLDILPPGGVIYSQEKVVFHEGETVFNVLVREMKKNKIHLEFANTPGYDSAYIEGIANIYEYDCGELSGWMYKVNGEFPNYGCSKYKLKNGDVITWVYTCDLGKDIGGEKSARNGK